MADDKKAVAFLELNIKGFQEALNTAKAALALFGVSLAAFKTAEFWKDGIEGAIKFGNEAYFAAQKLNGYDPGKLFIVQKALQAGGLAAEEARGKIEEFGLAGRPLEQLFKGGKGGFADALTRASREYGTQAAVLTKSAEEFAFVQGQISALGTKMQGFFLGLADKISRPLSDLFSTIDKIDLVGMGEKFGGYIVDAINTVKGLIGNGSFLNALKLGLKVGFQEAANYLLGAVNSIVDILTSSDTWSGLGTTLIGVLGVVGSFLTTLFLGIGKLVVATVEAAIEQLREKYPWIKGATERKTTPIESLSAFVAGGVKGVHEDKSSSPFHAFANFIFGGIDSQKKYKDAIHSENKKNNLSTDASENLKNIQGNSAIQSLDKLGDAQLKMAEAAAKGGWFQLSQEKVAPFKKAALYDTQADAKDFLGMILKAKSLGASTTGPDGKKNPVFSETADPYHVIADSLAKVGGGGRYVRTGLSIADKAAQDAVRFSKQQAELQAKYLPNLGKIGGNIGSRFSVTGG